MRLLITLDREDIKKNIERLDCGIRPRSVS